MTKVYKNNKIYVLLFAILMLVIFFSLGFGSYKIAAGDVLHILAAPFDDSYGVIEHQIIWNIRLPRILTAALAGCTLAVCGASLQGVFHNPLVEPQITGVTFGAAFGGTLAILFKLKPYMLILSSFIWGLIALIIVYWLARCLKSRDNLILVLSGIITGGFFSALVNFLKYTADSDEQLPGIVFWLMGSFAVPSWSKLAMFAVPTLICIFFLLRLRWRINILSLGDKEAASLGINVSITKWLILVLCAMAVSSQVAVSGGIGWVGLVIPHMVRIFTGADHRVLLPAAAISGGIFMVAVDNFARLLTTSEIPVGIITALFGAPFFTILLLKSVRRDR